MNALGDWRYVTKEDIASFGGERQRRAALSTGFIGQTWRHNYSITARVPFTHSFASLPASLAHTMPKTPRGSSSQIFLGDPVPPAGARDPFSHAAASFVHGGITPEYLLSLSTSNPISKINALGSSILYSLLDNPAPLSLPRGATEEEREFWSERGPMWNREYALEEDEASICERAEKACEMLGVRHLLMGHTPHFGGIVSAPFFSHRLMERVEAKLSWRDGAPRKERRGRSAEAIELTPCLLSQVSRCGGKILLIDTGASSFKALSPPPLLRAFADPPSALPSSSLLLPPPPSPLHPSSSPKGISRAYGGAHSALEMLYTLTPVEDDSEEEGTSAFASGETTKWVEREVVSAMYTGGR